MSEVASLAKKPVMLTVKLINIIFYFLKSLMYVFKTAHSLKFLSVPYYLINYNLVICCLNYLQAVQ